MTDDRTLDDIQPGKYADVMPDMDDDEYDAIKRSIEENGYDKSEPIVVDEDGDIVDGHHRYRACTEVGVEPAIVTDPDASVELAYRKNLARRNLDGGDLREAVGRYLKKFYDGERSQRTLAGDLGVSVATVNRAFSDLNATPSGVSGETVSSVTDSKPEQSGDSSDSGETKDREQQVAEYLAENPDASNREVARNVEADVSHVTVGNWRGDDSEPEKDGDEESSDGVPESDADDDAKPDTDADDEDGDNGTVTSLRRMDEVERERDEYRDEVDRLTKQAERKDARIEELEAENADLREQVDDRTETEKDARIRDLEGRVDELEALVRDFRRAVENQDAEAVQATAERAGELVP